jgi:hypothetical protein
MNNVSKKGKAQPSQTKTVTTTTAKVVKQTPQPKKPQQQQPQHKKNTPKNSVHPAAKAYAQTLNDPWNFPGAPIGFGTMVGTKTATSSWRGKLTSNATDGSMTVFAFPGGDVLGAAQSQLINTSPAYTDFSFLVDGTATNARSDFMAARPISMGIRITPLNSNNDKAIRATAGLVPYTTLNQITGTGTTDMRTVVQSTSTGTWYSEHGLQSHVLASGGHDCVEALWRPQDLESYNFTRDFLQFNTMTSTVVLPSAGPVCIVSIMGPAYQEYECNIVCRYEALPAFGSLFAASEVHGGVLSSAFPSLEKMWEKVSTLLQPDSIKTAASAANIVWDAWTISQRSSTMRKRLQGVAVLQQDEREHKAPPTPVTRTGDEDKKSPTPPRSPSYFS